MIEKINNNDFTQRVINAENPVIVDFYADWCMPCKMVAPVIEEIQEENMGKIEVFKINVDESPELAKEYSIMSIPCILSFKQGKLHKRVVGAQSKQALLELID